MFRRLTVLVICLAAVLMAGCMGQSKQSGKFSNQDKPKPVNNSNP